MSGTVIEINAGDLGRLTEHLEKLAEDGQVIRCSPAPLGWMAKAMLTAAAAKIEFGAKYHGHIRARGNSMEGTGSDGYRVHVANVDLLDLVLDVEFTIPRAALEWIVKNHRIFKADQDSLMDPVAEIRLTLPDDGPTPENPGRILIVIRQWDDEGAPAVQYEGPLVPDAYPTAAHLFEIARDAKPAKPAALSLDALADARALRTTTTAEPTIKYTRSVKVDRPAPALLEFWEGEHLRAAALIQPRLSVDEAAAGGAE